MSEELTTDEMCIAKWQQMLKAFKIIIAGDPAPEKVKDKLLALKEAATNATVLTARQREGIHGRCDNYIAGTFGKDAVKDGYTQKESTK